MTLFDAEPAFEHDCSHALALHDEKGRCTYPGCRCGEVADPVTTSRDNHRERMRSQALAALDRAGLTESAAALALDALASASVDYCVCCGYKRKGATGGGAPTTLEHLDGMEEVVRNPQRDGDASDPDIRERHYVTVLRALFTAEERGLTDEELTQGTGIFHDSAKGARANLVSAGWVMASDTLDKRDSVNGRPMTVWELTPRARAKLVELRGY